MGIVGGAHSARGPSGLGSFRSTLAQAAPLCWSRLPVCSTALVGTVITPFLLAGATAFGVSATCSRGGCATPTAGRSAIRISAAGPRLRAFPRRRRLRSLTTSTWRRRAFTVPGGSLSRCFGHWVKASAGTAKAILWLPSGFLARTAAAASGSASMHSFRLRSGAGARRSPA